MSMSSQAIIQDSKLARAVTEIVRDTETELLFNYSSRVYQFGALSGAHRGLTVDRELLYAGAMCHDVGLTYGEYSDVEREAVVSAFSRTPDFKEDIIQAF